MKNILVAIDRTKHAEQLIAKAVEIAKMANAKIWILHVTEPDPDSLLALEAGPQYLYERRAEDRKNEAAIVRKYAEEITAKSQIPAEGLLVEGEIPKAIKDKVEEHSIDLVVAGHKRKNFLYELFTANKKKDLIDEMSFIEEVIARLKG